MTQNIEELRKEFAEQTPQGSPERKSGERFIGGVKLDMNNPEDAEIAQKWDAIISQYGGGKGGVSNVMRRIVLLSAKILLPEQETVQEPEDTPESEE